jgi:hypothetical protein
MSVCVRVISRCVGSKGVSEAVGRAGRKKLERVNLYLCANALEQHRCQ